MKCMHSAFTGQCVHAPNQPPCIGQPNDNIKNNPDPLRRYLWFRYIQERNTFINNIHLRLLHGHLRLPSMLIQANCMIPQI